MNLTKVALLSLPWVALGCHLLSSSDDRSPGTNPPIMYGAGSSNGGATTIGPGGSGGSDAGGIRLDAATGSDDAADGGARGDGGPDATGTEAGKADAGVHTSAQNWIRFGAQKFAKCTWFSALDGLCSDAPSQSSSQSSWVTRVFKTADGGKSWLMSAVIDSETTAPDAVINVYVLSATDLWLTSGSVTTQSGSVRHSIDGGITWMSLTGGVAAALGVVAGDGGVASVPVWQLVSAASRVWLVTQGAALAFSPDGGNSWNKLAPSDSFSAAKNRSLIVTQGHLLAEFLAPDNSLALLRWNGSTFGAVEGVLPPSSAGDYTGTWWRSSPNVEGILFMDRGPLPGWASPFLVYATTDGGATFRQLLAGSTAGSDVVGLSDGLAFAAFGSVTAYVAGVFSDGGPSRYLEIRETTDAGKTWSTPHSEPFQGDSYISLAIDSSGKVHAMRYPTNAPGAPIAYDAHYVLP